MFTTTARYALVLAFALGAMHFTGASARAEKCSPAAADDIGTSWSFFSEALPGQHRPYSHQDHIRGRLVRSFQRPLLFQRDERQRTELLGGVDEPGDRAAPPCTEWASGRTASSFSLTLSRSTNLEVTVTDADADNDTATATLSYPNP